MPKHHITVPEPGVREIAHGIAYRIAREQLTLIADLEEQCRISGARYLSNLKTITLNYLNNSYNISYPDGNVSLANSGESVPLRDKILLLHYFTCAKGTPLTGKIITYRELQEGINYYPTFFKRAIAPVIESFKDKPQKFLEIAGKLGGYKAGYGDIAATIDAFPHVPVTIVLWQGDTELPAEGNIMFDSTIRDYLPTEDITILCEVIAWKMVRLLANGGDTPVTR